MSARRTAFGVLVALGLLATLPADAVIVNAAVCTFTVHVSFSPGLSATNGYGQFSSGKGSVQCVGVVNAAVNPAGTIDVYGWYGDDPAYGPETCDAGAGGIGLGFNVPANGPGNGSYAKYRRSGMYEVMGSDLSYGTPVAAFQITPDAGQDCTNTPITSATFSGVFRTYG